MADPVAMDAIVAEVRRLGGFETLDEANSFATKAEIESRANRNLRKVYLALVRKRGAKYFTEDATPIVTVAGTKDYDLEDDFLELLTVDRVSGDIDVPLLDCNDSERDAYQRWPQRFSIRGQPTHYQLRGSSIRLLPTPAGAETIKITYVPAYADITGSGTFDGIAGFEEWAIWETVAELVDKDARDPAFAMAEAKWWADEVESMAPRRDGSGPRRIKRVRQRRRYGRWP